MPCFSGTVLTWKCQGDLGVVPECRGNKVETSGVSKRKEQVTLLGVEQVWVGRGDDRAGKGFFLAVQRAMHDNLMAQECVSLREFNNSAKNHLMAITTGNRL